MRILITGAKGMLAKAIMHSLKDKNELICTDVSELDITKQEEVCKMIQSIKPQCIINCAAYTAVDKAEEEEKLADNINALGPKNLAVAAESIKAILVHISTDYVFGGDKPIEEIYTEEDEKLPNTVYGKTKLKGEIAIQENCSQYYIFRTAWLYGDGNNFVRTMLKLAKQNKEINVVADQQGSPTYAVDLAAIIKQALEKEIPYGIYHATNEGYTTWYGFAKEIFKLANIPCKVNPVTTEEFPRPAKRPANSKMSKEKLNRQGIHIARWEEALAKYIEEETKNK